MRRIAKMPLWAESRIHGDVYVRFGGRLSETYHRKVAWRRQPSLHVFAETLIKDLTLANEKSSLKNMEIVKRNRKKANNNTEKVPLAIE